MDHLSHDKSASRYLGFSHRIRALSKDSLKLRAENISLAFQRRINGKTYRALLATCTLAISLLFGVLAQSWVGRTTLEAWLKDHAPPAETWRTLLDAHHYRLVNETSILQKISRTLPSQLDLKNSLWISTDGHWLVIYQPDANAPAPYELFVWEGVLSQKMLPIPAWEYRGTSWEGMEFLSHWLGEKQQKPLASLSKRALDLDSREIRY